MGGAHHPACFTLAPRNHNMNMLRNIALLVFELCAITSVAFFFWLAWVALP